MYDISGPLVTNQRKQRSAAFIIFQGSLAMANPISDNDWDLNSVFRVVGDQLSAGDVAKLKLMYESLFTSEFLAQINDGYSFFLALEKADKLDSISRSDTRLVRELLRVIDRRDLYPQVCSRRRTGTAV